MDSFWVWRLTQLSLIFLQLQTGVSVCVNLSRNKKATQSSTLSYNNAYWTADKALDGVREYHEHDPVTCSGTNADRKSWWQLDLGTELPLNRIEVFGRPHSPPYQLLGFQAYVSKEKGNRTLSSLVYYNNLSPDKYNKVNGHFVIKINTTVARYVSILLDQAKVEDALAFHIASPLLVLCEVMVFKCEDIPGTNKQIYGTSVSSGYSPRSWNAILDGNISQDADTCKCCAYTDQVKDPWLRVDLGKQIRVSQITVYGRNDQKQGNLDTLQTLHIYLHNSEWVKGSPLYIVNSTRKYTVTKQLFPSRFGQFVTLQLEGRRFLAICEVIITKECPKFSYGEKCLQCGHCIGNEPCDQATGHCTQCAAGYLAPLCTEECQPGKYGDCKQTCGGCNSSDICDVKTGICPNGCDKGYKANQKCDQECEKPYYGYNCSQACGHCLNSDPCNKTDGHCSACDPGFNGYLCKTECNPGFYDDCEHKCGSCNSSDTCDTKDGVCPNGCERGYKATPKCDQVCDDHSYGYNCTQMCGKCLNNVPCNKTDGHCLQCEPGFKGIGCNIKCGAGYYGNCIQKCGGCKSGDVCNFKTGVCQNGCDKGYKATPKCDQVCGQNTYGENCTTNCTNCRNDTCKPVNGTCTFGCTGNFHGERCDIYSDEQTSQGSQSTTITATVSAVVAVVVVIVIAVVIAFLLYKRRLQMKKKPSVPGAQSEYFENAVSEADLTTKYAKISRKHEQPTYAKPDKTEIELAQHKKQTKTPAESETSENGHEYYSFTPLANDLTIQRLWSYIKKKKLNNCKMFYEEFKNLKTGLVEKHDIALDPANRLKNRYREMFAYDDTRVVLDIDEEGATDYINACYITGYERVFKFIASQGPIKDMDKDFWRMVWQQKSSTIVMLTNLFELGVEKCKKYWPDAGEEYMIFGKIKIKFSSEENFGDFIVRKLMISRGSETDRTVTQYHFRAWPDKDVPDTTWCLVNFWRTVMADDVLGTKRKPPIVVHCSAGIGRTGTFIGLDNLYHQAKTEGSLRPFQMVETLRKQRVNMVQTREQYVFLHEAVADALLFGTHHILADQYKDVYTFLTGLDPETRKSRLQLQFELMVESLKDQRNHQGSNNEYSNIYSQVEGETSITDGTAQTFTFMPDNNNQNTFVVTKKPTEDTLDEFWSFVDSNNIRTFVIAKDSEESKDKTSSWLSRGSNSFHVNSISKRKGKGFLENNFTYNRRNKDEDSLTTIRQFEMTTWEDGAAPSDPASVIRLYEGIRCWQSRLKKSEPILIYCSNGSERSGLLYALLMLLFKFGAENDDKKFNILETVMGIKQRNMSFIPSFDQYKFIHDAIQEYLTLDEATDDQVYVNFKG